MLFFIRGDYFWIDSVFIKKKIKSIFLKNRNWFKPTGFGSVWLFLGQKLF